MPVEVIQSGTWTYRDAASNPVHIVRADFDFWYDVAAADAQLQPGEQPALNDDGVAYYVLYRELDPDRFWPDDGPLPSVEHARRTVERRVPTVEWRA